MRRRRDERRALGRWGALARLVRLATVAIRHGGAHLLSSRLPAPLSRRFRPLPGPVRLRLAFEDLGGTFIKFGQLLALQPDILSLATCDALMDLLDRVPPFEQDEVRRLLVEELGRQPEEVFDELDVRPLATASVGQVHVARLGGRAFAVKVQRPRVAEEFASDLMMMLGLLTLVRRLRLTSLSWIFEPVEEFAAWSREELDYRYEARYMDRLRANARDNPVERVPQVLHEASSRRVLSAELLDGVTVLGYLRALESGDEVTLERLRRSGFEPTVFARNVIANFLGDAFRHGMFHADLHPANLMILPGNVVGYIDFGITGVLSRHSRRHLVTMTLAYTRGDLDGMCQAFFEVSATSGPTARRLFRAGLDQLAQGWYERDGKRVRLRKNFTLMMLDMLRLSRRTGVLPERDVVKYIRSAIALDGLITRFAPGFDVGAYVAEMSARELALGRAELFRPGELSAGLAGAGRLAFNGPAQALGALRRLASGELTLVGEAEVSPAPLRAGAVAQRAVAACALAVVLLATAGATTTMPLLVMAEGGVFVAVVVSFFQAVVGGRI